MDNRRLRRVLISTGIFAFIAGLSAQSQESSSAIGTFDGKAGPLPVKLHISASADGSYKCVLDSPNQGAYGTACTDIQIDGKKVSFAQSNVGVTWKGTVEDGGAKLVGTWTQGVSMPLTFVRDPFVAADKPSAVDGFWLGTLVTDSNVSLRIQIEVKSDKAGKEYCSLDSLDQRGFGMTCANVVLSAAEFAFDIPAVNGHFSGTLAQDQNSLSGTWSQNNRELPLNLQRQAARQPPPPQRKPPSLDPAIAPVSAEELQTVLTRDLEKALTNGALAPETNGGVTIGIVRNGVRRVFSFGTAKVDSIFEIGSISKTFTGLILAQLVEQNKVELEEPVRAFLPAGTVDKPDGAEITLLDLVTQRSGLPRMPNNFKPGNRLDPYFDYHADNLYQFMHTHGVAKPAAAGYLYSNLGFGLLGQALANRSKANYEALLKQQVLEPLCMHDTSIVLSEKQTSRFIQGYTAAHKPTPPWNLDAFAGAGAIRSTASDMLTYLEAQLDPKNQCVQGRRKSNGRTLATAITEAQIPRAEIGPGVRIGFAWGYRDDSGSYSHNGATGGYNSTAIFNPKQNYALVVLFNTTAGAQGSFADLLGRHIEQRLTGKPAVSLGE